MVLHQLIFFIPFLSIASCRVYSIENEDGSYTIGLNSDSRGESANSVLALLTKAAGYTLNDNYETPEQYPVESTPESNEHILKNNNEESTPESRGLLEPHLEILQLIEVFLKFKGELASRFHGLITDNYDLIRSVYTTLVNKIGTLHSFTLTGIKILRKLLEIGTVLLGQWQVNLPPVSLDLNVGNGGGDPSASFHLTKNGLLFNKK